MNSCQIKKQFICERWNMKICDFYENFHAMDVCKFLRRSNSQCDSPRARSDAEQREENRIASLESQLRELSRWALEKSIGPMCEQCTFTDLDDGIQPCVSCKNGSNYQRHPALKIADEWGEE